MSQGPTAQRAQVLLDLLELVVAVRPRERAVVGIDGPDGVGKSTLAAELLAVAPAVSGREVVGVGIDSFHRPRAERYAHGRDAESYYRHAFDYDALRRCVLDPFRAGREIVPAVHDVATDEAVFPDPIEVGEDALLLLDGVFLQRQELQPQLDAVLLVTADLEVTVPRGNARFARPAEEDDPDHPANARYVGAQRMYAHELRRQGTFPTWILDNTDLDRPRLLQPDVEAGWRSRGFSADGPHVDWPAES
ncbi:uridine kinase [Pseudactinotalea sp.]|uniref:uridine kinase n=1 Tax=Pseudactinotalea sp. TaxID=1926260 RepID=UPI003B3A9881